jgi:hypothetical protein
MGFERDGKKQKKKSLRAQLKEKTDFEPENRSQKQIPPPQAAEDRSLRVGMTGIGGPLGRDEGYGWSLIAG